MGNHMSFEMGASFESFIAALLFAYILSVFAMTFAHVAIEVTSFSKLSLALRTNVSSFLFLSQLSECRPNLCLKFDC
jgi:hypothetical protein